MSETMNTVFNMNNCFALNSDDKAATIQFGAYNGHMVIAIWGNNGRKPIKMNVSFEYFSLIFDTIDDAFKSAPGAAFPIKTMKWDMQTKKRDIANIFTIGKDSNNIFFLEYKEPDGPIYKFPFLGNKNIESPIEGGDAERSLRAFKGFARFVKMNWMNTANFTRNNLIKLPAKGGAKSSGGSQSNYNSNNNHSNYNNSSSMASEDDIY